jgi:CRP-like cAMP-binding protein
VQQDGEGEVGGNVLKQLQSMIFLKSSVHKVVTRTRNIRRNSIAEKIEKRQTVTAFGIGALAAGSLAAGSIAEPHRTSGVLPLDAQPIAQPNAAPNASNDPTMSRRESLVEVSPQPKPPASAEQGRRMSTSRRMSNGNALFDEGRSGRRRSGQLGLLQINYHGGNFVGMKEPVQVFSSRDKGDGQMDLMVAAKAKRAGKKFLRLGGPGARVEFLKEHPFFQGTSQALRERLAPQLVRRSVEQVNSDVLRQGDFPEESTDYLFLTSPDFNADIEVILDGHCVAVLCGGVVFGQEAVFQVTKTFLFGIKVPADAVQFLWVIPRTTLQKLLKQEMFKDDAEKLARRAHTNIIWILRGWYLHPISHTRLRLFDNADYAFRQSLIQGIDMKLFVGGTTICEEHTVWSDAIFVFRGEAQIKIGGGKVGRLAHTHGMNAWAAWWGILEAIGTCPKATATVEAVTDCIVWQLSPKVLAELRQSFPMECRVFDKVAVEHVKLLRSYALKIQETWLTFKCDPFFLKTLDARCECRIYRQGEVVIREGDTHSDEIYVIIRGHVEVRKSLKEKDDGDISIASLSQGEWFGEVATLGIRNTRTATVVCTTLCDMRVLPRASVLETLVRFPDQGSHLEKLAEQRGYVFKQLDTQPNLAGLPFFSSLSMQFLEALADEMTSLTTFKLQPIIDQGQPAKGMFVLLQGKVSLTIDDAAVYEIKAPGVIGEFSLVDSTAKSIFAAQSACLCRFRVVTSAKAMGVLQNFPDDETCLGDIAAESLETLRAVLLRRFHGMNLSSVAKKQAAGFEECEWESESTPPWWAGTLFQDSEERFLDYLAQHINKAIFFADEVMILEGDEGDFALVIVAGHATVEVGGVRVGEVKTGSLVGEAALLGNVHHRTATVRAVGIVSVVVIARSVFVEALEEFPAEMKRVEELMLLRKSANKVLKFHTAADHTEKSSATEKAPISGSFRKTFCDLSKDTRLAISSFYS